MEKRNIRIVINSIILLLTAALFVGTALATEAGMEESESFSVTALVTNAWMHYAEWFIILTAYPAVIMMLFIAFSLHLARPMVTRYLNRMTLRLGADILWEAWIIGRDVLILASVAFLGVLIQPRLIEEWYTGVLVPAFVLGLITLVFKLVTDTDASKGKYILATALTGLTLVAATLPYGIPSLWHDKGHMKFESEFFVPISQQENAGKMIKAEEMQSPKMVVDSVKDAIKNAISAMEAGNKDKALAEAREAEETHEKIEAQLMAWSMEKHQKLEAELDELIEAAEKGDTNAMKKAWQEIDALLDEFEKQKGA